MGYWDINNGAAFIYSELTASQIAIIGQAISLIFILVVYHVILVWRLIRAEHEVGLSMSVPATIVTHLAVLGLLVGLNVACRHVPYLRYIRYALPALAPFERDWLFKAPNKKNKKKAVPASEEKAAAVANAVAAAATLDDYEEWLKYLSQPGRPPRKPGVSVQDEYKQWLVARARAKIAPRPRG